jgi:hypothetical protein
MAALASWLQDRAAPCASLPPFHDADGNLQGATRILLVRRPAPPSR